MSETSSNIALLQLKDFSYPLPDDRIASSPLDERDTSKLLVYQAGQIRHQLFNQIGSHLPQKSLLVFNDTQVIQARLYFRRKTGALIEVLLLNPHEPKEVQQAMQAKARCIWACMIGNKRKWKEGEVLERKMDINGQSINLTAILIDRDQQKVELKWRAEGISFASLLAHIGELPLPPYLNRKATKKDLLQYQTVYAKHEGAVAAPTAGLHFTDKLLKRLKTWEIHTCFVTLHVSAGTFLPVKHEQVAQHTMHAEQLIISQDNLNDLLLHVGSIIPVGTTSMRVLESTYWLGVKLMKEGKEAIKKGMFHIPQNYPYLFASSELPSAPNALLAIKAYMEKYRISQLIGETSIFIMPSYKFQLCRGLITNYHLPESTLIMLVAAFIGEDWRKVYQAALDHGYRFLSYGDASLLLPS